METLRHSYCALALSALTATTCVIQSLLGWKLVLSAIGFVPSAAWSPSSWFSILPGQSIPVVLTWFTYVFPHMGWAHMATNVLGLLLFGGVVEGTIGTRNFTVVALLSVVSGVFALAAVHPHGSTPIGGGSLLLCTIIGIWLALYYRRSWEHHPRATLAMELAAVAAVTFWLIFRITPLAPSPFLAVMWHGIPLMTGWLGYRVAATFPTTNGVPRNPRA